MSNKTIAQIGRRSRFARLGSAVGGSAMGRGGSGILTPPAVYSSLRAPGGYGRTAAAVGAHIHAQYVTGPGSATDHAIARWDGVTGKLLQDTANAILTDAGALTLGDLLSGTVFEFFETSGVPVAYNTTVDGSRPHFDLHAYVGAAGAGGSTAAVGPAILGTHARGTFAIPTQTLNTDTMMRVGALGYGATAFGNSYKCFIDFASAENWTDAAQGTMMRFFTVPTGSITAAERMRISSWGAVQHQDGSSTYPSVTSLTYNTTGLCWSAGPTLNLIVSSAVKMSVAAAGVTIGTLAGYIKGTAGLLSGQTGVPHTDLTYTGLTAGHVLKATAATAASFGELLHSQLGTVTSDQHHARAHALLTVADHSDVATYLNQALLTSSAPTFAGLTLSADIVTSDSDFVIKQNTADASDANKITIAGGGAHGQTRGASIIAAGNEFSANYQGTLVLTAGNPGTAGTYDGAIMCILASGKALMPSADSTANLGALAYYWANAYLDLVTLNATATISGANAGDVTIGGNLRFGTYAAITTEVAAGYITVKDAAGNSRKVMVCA